MTTTSAPMRALTLIQPWAWCITHSDKRVENRTWAPPASLLGQRFAIHAGKANPDAHAIVGLERDGIRVSSMLVLGAVVATARVVAVTEVDSTGAWRSALCADHNAARVMSLLGNRRGTWFIGPIGWVLDDVNVLREPVACRGAQGIWVLPKDVEERVRAQGGCP